MIAKGLCTKHYQRGRKPKRVPREPITILPTDLKTCKNCKQAKPYSEFGMHRISRDGFKADCRECRADEGVRRRDKNPDRNRENWLKRNYGISQEDYARMLAEQGGKCAICSLDEANSVWGRLAVDHDHQTGKIRGLLCSPCNTGIGNFKDNVDRLNRALEYLLKGRD